MPELARGTIVAFDASSHTVTARLAGSLATTVEAVPVSRSIPASELLAGRRIAIALFDPANPLDALVIGVR